MAAQTYPFQKNVKTISQVFFQIKKNKVFHKEWNQKEKTLNFGDETQ